MHLISVHDSRHSIFYGEKTLELNSIAQGTCIKGCLLKTAAIEIHWDKFTYSRIWSQKLVSPWLWYGEIQRKSGERSRSENFFRMQKLFWANSEQNNASTMIPGRGWYKLESVPHLCKSTTLAPKTWKNELILLNFYSPFTAGIHMHCRKIAVILTLIVENTTSYTNLLKSLRFHLKTQDNLIGFVCFLDLSSCSEVCFICQI